MDTGRLFITPGVTRCSVAYPRNPFAMAWANFSPAGLPHRLKLSPASACAMLPFGSGEAGWPDDALSALFDLSPNSRPTTRPSGAISRLQGISYRLYRRAIEA